MTLGRALLLVVLLAIVAWLIMRTVSVQSTPEKVRITIDKQKLEQAGQEAREEGRKAVQEGGQLLERAGKRLENGKPAPAAPSESTPSTTSTRQP
jgi:hypothetical protein